MEKLLIVCSMSFGTCIYQCVKPHIDCFLLKLVQHSVLHGGYSTCIQGISILPFPKLQILDCSKLKEFANNSKFYENEGEFSES